MLQVWKLPHLVKGIATHVPMLDKLRINRAATGGSNSARYCYSVWLRHLSLLALQGFSIRHAKVGELGPGDSIGTGLAAVLSGAKTYIGLDAIPFSARADLLDIFQDLVRMFCNREAIPNDREFPGDRPKLQSYLFPHHLVDCSNLTLLHAQIREELKKGLNRGELITYRAPWDSFSAITPESLDLIFSQAVLEHVDRLSDTYEAMFAWLKPGGYASHTIDFTAHYLSPVWNGHWAYTPQQWHLVRGRREFLLNRKPLSAHVASATKAGFKILLLTRDYDLSGLTPQCLSAEFRNLDSEDAKTRGCVLILIKPK